MAATQTVQTGDAVFVQNVINAGFITRKVDRRGKPRYRYMSQRQFRTFPVPADIAELLIATGAVEVGSKGWWE